MTLAARIKELSAEGSALILASIDQRGVTFDSVFERILTAFMIEMIYQPPPRKKPQTRKQAAAAKKRLEHS